VIKSVVKKLEMMGYEVVNNTTHEYLMVMFRTRNGYACYYSLKYDELREDSVMFIVAEMNARIRNDL
jgi:hypothetical protein